MPSDGPVVPFGAMVEHRPISAMIPSCGACTTAALLTREESARTACRFCSIKRRERGNGGVWRCMRVTKASAVERS